MKKDVVIVNATRTPFGKFGGVLLSMSAIELGTHVVKEVLKPFDIPKNEIDEVIMGTVVSAGLGQIPARNVALKAGLPFEVRCLSINKVCASGLKAVTLGVQSIMLGDSDIVVAGGMESMSNSPYLLDKTRWGYRMGDGKVIDAMIKDGLWCFYHDVHMGNHGNKLAIEFNISREEQDKWALRSHQRAIKATESGRFKKEISPVSITLKKDTIIVDKDESIRKDTSIESLSKLQPVFGKDGTITAGNAPGVNDGAGVLLIMSYERAKSFGIKPLARIVGYGESAAEPSHLGMVPALAIKNALKKSKMALKDIDLIEINEAFAVVTLISMKMLEIDPEIVNVNGGAIALGHPIGASGARILMTLIYELIERKKQFGVCGICSGAAQGDAVIVENLTL